MTDFDCTPQVDLEFMNAEHRKAFDDANQIKRLLEIGKTDLSLVEKRIDRCLDKLLADTENHFYLEEKYMEQYQFPAREKHRLEHHQFLRAMNIECRLWQSTHNLAAAERLERYIDKDFPQWLVNHIVTMDTVTATYIARHGGSAL
ncbi:MAG: hemerythrin family protein [Porticoccaceae bacterium]|nr:hemerythrin family protein [Porticoccaceae bacterium]